MSDVRADRPCPVCDSGSHRDERYGALGLRRCAGCQFVFLDDDGLDVDELYDDRYFEGYAGGDYRSQEGQRRQESRVRLSWMQRWTRPPGLLYELGTAAGFFLDEARSLGYEVAGVELSAGMARHARESLALDVTRGRIEDVLPPRARFDVACAWHVVEHLPRPLETLARVFEWLRPGGHVFVEVPNLASAAAKRMGPDWPALDLPHHVGHHGPMSLRTLLERTGLEVLSVDTIPFASYDRHRRWTFGARVGLEAIRVRSRLPLTPDPSRHQLLRAVGRRPA